MIRLDSACVLFLCASLLVFGCDTTTNVTDPPPPPPSPPPPPPQVDSTFTNNIGMDFVLIPKGSFAMGSIIGDEDEQPVHGVTLDQDFYMSVFETTQGDYQTVTDQNPSQFTGDDRRPVEFVTWIDAVRFANALSVREGLAPCYDDNGTITNSARNPYQCVGYRLPTEAEWEYACRAGSRTAYSFGSDSLQLGDYAWYKANASEETHPVGQKLPNAWALYDMHGNVFEWVHDFYDPEYYATSPQNDPFGLPADPDPAGSFIKAVRGGSWYHAADLSRSSHRNLVARDFGGVSRLGFRVARTVK